MSKRRKLAQSIADRTQDAYSYDRYAKGAWEACAFWLLGCSHTEQEVEAILRSKYMHWAGDMAEKTSYGHHNSADLQRFWKAPANRGLVSREAIAKLTLETFG